MGSNNVSLVDAARGFAGVPKEYSPAPIWWWSAEKYKTPELSPTERRVIDTVKWVVRQYGLDENRVYLCGNSMGGSGTLGIGMRHGDVFARRQVAVSRHAADKRRP